VNKRQQSFSKIKIDLKSGKKTFIPNLKINDDKSGSLSGGSTKKNSFLIPRKPIKNYLPKDILDQEMIE
jgi:hypothetical protein